MKSEGKKLISEKQFSVIMGENRVPGFKAKLDPYVPGDDFEIYLNLVTNYFVLTNVEEDVQKVRLLINQIGTTASTKVIKALKPKKFEDATFQEVSTLCTTLFVGKRRSVVDHYKLIARHQREGETLRDFAIDLQALGERCTYDAQNLDLILRDHFIYGLLKEETRTKLMETDDNKTFLDVVGLAEGIEQIREESAAMSSQRNVNRVEKRQGRGRSDQWSQVRNRSRERSPRDSEVTCYRCGTKGHFAKFCKQPRRFVNTSDYRYRNRRGPNSTNSVSDFDDNEGEVPVEEFENMMLDDSVNSIGGNNEFNFSRDRDRHMPYSFSSVLGMSINSLKSALVELQVESVLLRMEVDTGSCVTVCSSVEYKKYFSHVKLESCFMPLSVVSGERLKVLGKITVNVRSKRGNYALRMIVIDSKRIFTPLLGRDWLDILNPAWRSRFKLNKIESPPPLDVFRLNMVSQLKKDYPNVFDDDLSEPIRGFTVDIRMNKNAKPFVHKAYNLPFKLRDKVTEQLDQLEKMGVIEPIEYAEWASPMVVVVKTNKDLRICFDGSVTINPHIETHHYPLPVIDELITSKSGANFFCVLDLKGAYQQLMVSDSTKKLLAINTCKGLYTYKRLPFGVKPAASIFQSVMDKILKDLDKVQAYIDDILIWARTIKEMCVTLRLVFERLAKYNVKLNFPKCQWFVSKVKYLGHELSAEGISPNKEKVGAILKAPTPLNVTQLKAFIGMIMFYSKFMKNLNITLAPLYNLLKKGVHWKWDGFCQAAFERAKVELASEKLLTHYNPSLPIIVTCDASNEGIAGVLSHRVNGQERPVFYASRTLTVAEKKYPILHREALAIVFAMEKFYKYVYGNHVEIYTDHKPLEGIFGSKKGEPPVIATRLQRYVLRLSIFDYALKYKKGNNIGHADCLSRLPIDHSLNEIPEDQQKFRGVFSLSNGLSRLSVRSEKCEADINEENTFETNETLTVNSFVLDNETLRSEIVKDDCLRRVREYTMNGWSNNRDKKELSFYYSKNQQLNVEDGCLTLGERKIIPASLKEKVLNVLHANHAGIEKMKQMARMHVYWEGMNKDITLHVAQCESCQMFRKDKTKVYGSWPETSFPFERVHLDFFHFRGSTFLILVDVYSHWLEVKRMSRTNAPSLINVLEEIFSVFGFPKEIVSDNGPPFGSYDLRKFLDERSIKLTHTPPYHPQSNGSAERAVQTTKDVLRKFVNDHKTNFQIDKAVTEFLFNNRNMPCTENKIIPSQTIMNFTPRCELSLLNKKETIAKVTFSLKGEEASKSEIFKPNELVLYLSKASGYCVGIRARIIKKYSKHTYVVEVEGNVKLAHVNQLRKTIIKPPIYGCPTTQPCINPPPEPMRTRSHSSHSESTFNNTSREEYATPPESQVTAGSSAENVTHSPTQRGKRPRSPNSPPRSPYALRKKRRSSSVPPDVPLAQRRPRRVPKRPSFFRP